MSIKRSIIAALLAATCLSSGTTWAASASESIDLDCTVTKVVDRREFVISKTFFDAARVITPEYRRITITDGQPETITYTVDATTGKTWTIPVTKFGKSGEGFTAEGTINGYGRWLYINRDGFVSVITWPDGTKSAAGGICKTAPSQDSQAAVPQAAPAPPHQTMMWTVPIKPHGRGIKLDGTVNDKATVHWMLDTGASLTSIPQDLADYLGLKPVRYAKFELADGSVVTKPIVVVHKLTIGGTVYATDTEATISDEGVEPLLGKNFLDLFASYEINNRQGQLLLHR
jgi:clan AA aspartic protease (TIGR02281 family)